MQSHVRFNSVPEKVPEKLPEKVWGGFGAEPGQVQQCSGEGSGAGSPEGSEEGLGDLLGAELRQVQQGSSCELPSQVIDCSICETARPGYEEEVAAAKAQQGTATHAAPEAAGKKQGEE